MEWTKTEDGVPPDGVPVIVKLKYGTDVYLVARYYDYVKTIDGEFRKVWVVYIWPRFPKVWMFSPHYNKACRFEKKLVTHWMLLPEVPNDVD